MSKSGPKIVMLCKRSLSELEKDLIEKFMTCIYFNERAHDQKHISELTNNCELLVLDISKDGTRVYYEGSMKWLKDNGIFIILLEKSGEKIDKSKAYGEDIVKKYLPSNVINKDLFIVSLKSAHVPKVKPTWKRYLSNIAFCIKSVN